MAAATAMILVWPGLAAPPKASTRSSAQGKARVIKSSRAHPPVLHPGRIAQPELPSEPSPEAPDLDGSKLFTADTETLPQGTWSLNAGYFVSNARTTFDEGGAPQPLGGTRRSELFIASASLGVSPDMDLTLLATANRLDDLFHTNPDLSAGLGPVQGAGLTNLSLQARWRLVRDEGHGFSLALVGGPALQEQLQVDDEDTSYQVGGGFGAWQQSLVLRQDLAPWSANLELFYAFPLASSPGTFQQYGANLGLGYNVSEWALPVVELNYSKALPYGDSSIDSLAATLGVILKPNPTSALSLGVQKTLCGRNVESFTTYCVSGSVSF